MMDRNAISSSIWALSIATFINRATGFLGLFAAIFFSETGMTPGTVVTALWITGIAGVAGSILGGTFADKFGKIPTLIGSTLINVFLFSTLAITDYSRTWLVIGLSAVSVLISQAFVGPASALVAESADGEDRVTRFAFYRIFINVGSIIAPALVGVIGREHFNILFWLSALGSLIAPLILLWGSRHGFQAPGVPADSPHAAPTPEVPLQRREYRIPLLLVYISMALAMIVYAQHQSAIPLRLDIEPNGLQLYSLLLLINPIIVILAEYPLSYLTKKIPAYIALSLGVIIMGSGVAITGTFAEFTAVAIGGWVLFSLGECIFAPMSNSYVADLSSTEMQSRSQGHLAAFQSIGAALGPGIGSWMFFVLVSGAWSGFLIMTVVSAALVLVAHLYTRSSTR